MKPHIADYQYRVSCVRIVPLLGDEIRITDYIHDLTFPGGEVYLSDAGYEFTGNASEADMTPGTFDIEGIIDVAGVDRARIASGALDGASLYVFDTTWTDPILDEEPRGKALLGKTVIKDDRYSVEAMSLIDALNQPIGMTYGATCPKRFGGQEYAGCKFDAQTVTVTGSVTSVTDRYIWQDIARLEPDDYFGAGHGVWTTGNNVGLKPLEIKGYALDGTVEMYEAFFYPIEVGDQYSMTPGCRKRLEDCRDKWNNILNFGGFARVPTGKQYTTRGTK